VGDSNSDRDMAETCMILSRICHAGNPNRAIVVIHHSLTGRGGAAKSMGADRSSYGRNSKALFAWTRGQINVAPVSEDDNDTLAIACGKNNNGREFPPFAIHLNPDTLIYDLAPTTDLDSWREKNTGSKPDRVTPAAVADLCPSTGATKSALAKLIIDNYATSRATAFRFVERADSSKTIRWDIKKDAFVPILNTAL
jgi:hypothetical protein